MDLLQLHSAEKTGANFNLETYLDGRELCIDIADEIISKVVSGMSEADGQQLIKETFRSHGINKFWHQAKFRIGADTLKDFRELPDTSLRTVAGDVCFIDLGPVIDDHEADYGRTFVVGDSKPNHLIESCEKIFRSSADAWKSRGLSGLELLNHADELSKSHGYLLNPAMAGHRLGDFPHKIHSSDKLFDFNGVPTQHLWILEIHILDSKNNRGAFFEDLLL